jgi:ribosomal protein S13
LQQQQQQQTNQSGMATLPHPFFVSLHICTSVWCVGYQLKKKKTPCVSYELSKVTTPSRSRLTASQHNPMVVNNNLKKKQKIREYMGERKKRGSKTGGLTTSLVARSSSLSSGSQSLVPGIY